MEFHQAHYDLARNAEIIRSMVFDVSDRQARWQPGPHSWSILEVIHHLCDEETLDFRVRLDVILHRPDQPWAPIDPEGWVVSRRYNEQDFPATLEKFLRARQESLAWLEELHNPDWSAPYQAPFGPVTAGDMLASWVAHDLLHMRQLVELKWAHATRQLQPFRMDYAGEW
jgi:hypothetical protein